MSSLPFWLSLFTCLAWLVFGLPNLLWLVLRTLSRRAPAAPSDASLPSLTVILAARDEAARIGNCLRSLLACDYPNLSILAVDDRSTDDTGEIMDHIAASDARVIVLHIEELPVGWLGKSHALHVAAEQADTDWILFTDGDILFSADTLRRAIPYADKQKVDHLILIPGLLAGGYWEEALVDFFSMSFAIGTQAILIPTPFRMSYAGVGAFNLIRADVYKEIGGHAAIRLDILDDVKLGKLVKNHNYKQDLLVGGDHVTVRWQNSAREVITGLEKNAFASMEYSLIRLGLLTLVTLFFFGLPYLGTFLFQETAQHLCILSVGVMHLEYLLAAICARSRWRVVPVLPIACLLMLFAFWRSAVITLRRGGVRWRDTFYPLAELKSHLYRG